jgi:predicted transcriptional regulator
MMSTFRTYLSNLRQIETMNIASHSLVGQPKGDSSWDDFPLDVGRLYRREREIAGIVYRQGLATANDIRDGLDDPLSSAAVRSMLNRLVRKGILSQLKCGQNGAFVYGPAQSLFSARELQLRRFADDFYDGSLDRLAKAIGDLFANEQRTDVARQIG